MSAKSITTLPIAVALSLPWGPAREQATHEYFTGPHAARVSASQARLDRAYGKAPTFNTNDSGTFKRAVDMTDDELAAIGQADRGQVTC